MIPSGVNVKLAKMALRNCLDVPPRIFLGINTVNTKMVRNQLASGNGRISFCYRFMGACESFTGREYARCTFSHGVLVFLKPTSSTSLGWPDVQLWISNCGTQSGIVCLWEPKNCDKFLFGGSGVPEEQNNDGRYW